MRKKRNENNKKTTKGFTLIELLIVLAIIGVVLASVTPMYTRYSMKAPEDMAGSPPKSDLAMYVENELKKLAKGHILFNPPKEMEVDKEETIEVRITKTITEELTKELKGQGIPQIEEIEVNEFMTARLTGNKFHIEKLKENGFVPGNGFAEWEWIVTPLEGGEQVPLFLTVGVRIKIPNHSEEIIDKTVFKKEILVKVNYLKSTKKFLEAHWLEIIGIIVGSGIIGWIYNKWREKES